jgi:hypothetical protein
VELYVVSINESSNAAIASLALAKRLRQGCTVHSVTLPNVAVLGKKNGAELRESEHCRPSKHPTCKFCTATPLFAAFCKAAASGTKVLAPKSLSACCPAARHTALLSARSDCLVHHRDRTVGSGNFGVVPNSQWAKAATSPQFQR